MTPAEIAAGLSEAQRRAFSRAEPDGHLGRHFIRTWHTHGRTLRAIRRAGLATAVWSGVMLTPLGLEVRAILNQESSRA